jgi:aspartyl-tRNA(Asn)/glutamyl-tRNA(Gln) amidotransferase subunit B
MPFQPTDAWLAEVKSRVVGLPLARKQRFMRDYDLTTDQAEAFKIDVGASDHFEKAAREIIANSPLIERTRHLRAIANTVIQQWRPRVMSQGLGWAALVVPISGTVGVSGSFARGEISSSAYQQVTAEMFATGQAPEKIIQAKGLAQVSDSGAIEKFCDEAIAANPGPAADYRAGKAAALNFLKGQVMKLSKGKANPALAGEILERKLKG